MSLTIDVRDESSRSPVIESLADRRRRVVLGLLLDRFSPMAERRIAIHLAATEQEKSITDVTQEEVETIRADLHHVQFPTLEEADLIQWDRDEETVTTKGHPALWNPDFKRIIKTEAPKWSAVVANLADVDRRIILAILAGQDGPLSRNELAQEVLTRKPNGDPQSDMETFLVSLHHVHLPKLTDAELVTYDVDTKVVTYQGHPDLMKEWLEFPSDETSGTVLTTAHQ